MVDETNLFQRAGAEAPGTTPPTVVTASPQVTPGLVRPATACAATAPSARVAPMSNRQPPGSPPG